jgi:hypothetical protein
MHRAIVFNGIWVFAATLLVFFLHGRQARRELDEQMNEGNRAPSMDMDMSKLATSRSPQQQEELPSEVRRVVF